jgi:hypothetical protein
MFRAVREEIDILKSDVAINITDACQTRTDAYPGGCVVNVWLSVYEIENIRCSSTLFQSDNTVRNNTKL